MTTKLVALFSTMAVLIAVLAALFVRDVKK